MAEPPYGIIWNRFKAGKVVPFLGAGASLVGRTSKEAWNPNKPKFLPSGVELAHFLADEATFPSKDSRDLDDLAKVSSYYSEIAGRSALRERLREVLNYDYKYGQLHEFLTTIPTHMVIVTTNYDTLIEQAYRAAGKPYDLVIYPADRKEIANAVLWWPHGAPEPIITAPNELVIDLDNTSVIYKMHGTIIHGTDVWDNFVITEEDYVEFLSRMTTNTAVPALFFPYFRERSFLFLGYSLRDWNLRVVLRNLSKHFSSRRTVSDEKNEEALPLWAIQLNPSELEQILWEKRGVNIFNLTLNEFVTKIRERGANKL
jgi:hypothetical protein